MESRCIEITEIKRSSEDNIQYYIGKFDGLQRHTDVTTKLKTLFCYITQCFLGTKRNFT